MKRSEEEISPEFSIKKDLYFLRIAEAVSSGSKCPKRSVGTVIVDVNYRIISTGFNGKPRLTDCDSDECKRLNIESGQNYDINCGCIHSECNAILYANFSDMQGGTIFVTHAPCPNCAVMILQSGVRHLVFYEDYRRDGVDMILNMTKDNHRLFIREYSKNYLKLVSAYHGDNNINN